MQLILLSVIQLSDGYCICFDFEKHNTFSTLYSTYLGPNFCSSMIYANFSRIWLAAAAMPIVQITSGRRSGNNFRCKTFELLYWNITEWTKYLCLPGHFQNKFDQDFKSENGIQSRNNPKINEKIYVFLAYAKPFKM